MAEARISSYYEYKTPLGPITIAEGGDQIRVVAFGSTLPKQMASEDAEHSPSKLTNFCANQIVEYLYGERTVFDVPYALEGEEPMIGVLKIAELVPYGQTISAQEVAEKLGIPGKTKAIVNASKRNPLQMIVPTHRIVPASKPKEGNAIGRAMQELRELEAKHTGAAR